MIADLNNVDIKEQLSQILDLLLLITPNEFSISFIADSTGTKRDTIYKYLQRNHIDGMDYKKKDGKIVVCREVGLELLRRYKNA